VRDDVNELILKQAKYPNKQSTMSTNSNQPQPKAQAKAKAPPLRPSIKEKEQGTQQPKQTNNEKETKKKEEEEEEIIRLQNLQKPIFDKSLFHKQNNKISGSLVTVDSEEPFLCQPMPITPSNLLSWLIPEKYDRRIPERFVLSEKLRYANEESRKIKKLKEDYHNTRELKRILASRLELGTAMIDVDGRLVPVPIGDPRPNGNNEMNQNINQNANMFNNAEFGRAHGVNQNAVGVDLNNNINNMGDPNMMEDDQEFIDGIDDADDDRGGGGGVLDFLDEQEERRRTRQRQEVDAANAIAAAVKRYRDNGVPEDDFIFVPISERNISDHNLTLRRILIAVCCVLAAFVCIMLQTIPLFVDIQKADPVFDKLLYDLLNVRYFGEHIQHCKGLQRENDCGDGVLHIPSKHILSKLHKMAIKDTLISKDAEQIYKPYMNGVNISWFHECIFSTSPNSTCVLRREYSIEDQPRFDDSSHNDTCTTTEEDQHICTSNPPTSCFRGVHDNIITEEEVNKVLDLGEFIIDNHGGDHMTIYEDVQLLNDHVPSIPTKLKSLLRSQYALPNEIQPVAFQINVAFPISYSSSSDRITKGTHTESLIKAMNETLYTRWYNHIRRLNDWTNIFSSSSSSKQHQLLSNPFRDPCILIADLEASGDFAFHTSVYLADGAGIDYSGGVSLFVDNHQDNVGGRNKVHRGVSIDGSRGRVVLSSGGEDNLRCRLPMRDGIRAELHIWWNCADD